MLTFAAQTSDLNEAVGYELSILEYLRAALLGQDESSRGGMSLTLGDLTEDGQQRAQVSLQIAANISEGAIREALHRLRPLAFSAAFKLQDMIAEWTLRANGISEWTFSKKLAGYDRLRAAGSLMEPSLFFIGHSSGEHFGSFTDSSSHSAAAWCTPGAWHCVETGPLM